MSKERACSILNLSNREQAIAQLLLDCFAQSCERDGTYDHGFISAYENAQEFLLMADFIWADECNIESGVDGERLLKNLGWED